MVFIQHVIAIQLIKKFLLLRLITSFVLCFPETVPFTQPVLTLYYPHRYFNSMLSSVIRSVFTNIYYALLIHTMYATCSTHLTFLHWITLDWETKLLSSSVYIILSIFHPPYHTALEHPQSTWVFRLLGMWSFVLLTPCSLAGWHKYFMLWRQRYHVSLNHWYPPTKLQCHNPKDWTLKYMFFS
jgi:hypothetical protein